MIYISATLAILFFTVGLWLFGIVQVAGEVVSGGRSALEILRNSALGDDAKEAAMRKASVKLLLGFVSILIRGILAIALSSIPIFAFDWFGLASIENTLVLLSTWEAILVATVVMTAGYFIIVKR